MAAVWHHDSAVSCVHPGWHRLDGWEEVERSWANIFANSRPWAVCCEDIRIALAGDLAWVTCVEVIVPFGADEESDAARMQATNLFGRVGGTVAPRASSRFAVSDGGRTAGRTGQLRSAKPRNDVKPPGGEERPGSQEVSMRIVIRILVVLVLLAGAVLAWLALRSPAMRPPSTEKVEATPERLARGEVPRRARRGLLRLPLGHPLGPLRDPRQERHGGTGGLPLRQEARRAGPRPGAEHHAGSGVRPRRLDRRRDPARHPRGRRPQGRGALPDDAVRVLPRR